MSDGPYTSDRYARLRAALHEIREWLASPEGGERELVNVVVVAQTIHESSDWPRTESYYPFGEPDPQVERGMLEQALSRLRDRS